MPDAKKETMMPAPAVVMLADARKRVLAHVATEPTTEVCGILIGRAEQKANGWICTIQDAIEGRFAREQAVSVTFTHDTWDYVHRVLDARDDQLSIVGWYHSHPGFGVFYSEHDMFVQSSFFQEPWQIGLVVDPVSGAEGIFANTGSAQPQPLESFEVLSDKDNELIICTYVEDPVRERRPDPTDVSNLRTEVEQLVRAMSEQDKRIAQTQVLAIIAVSVVAFMLIQPVLTKFLPPPWRFVVPVSVKPIESPGTQADRPETDGPDKVSPEGGADGPTEAPAVPVSPEAPRDFGDAQPNEERSDP